MKTLATVVTKRGQVSIPTQVRKQLRLGPGQRVVWEVVSDHECKMMVVAGSHLPGAEAMLGYAAKFRKPRRTRDWLMKLREGEKP
jgi:AbrB family looped-hinge helix DNA binding protein